MAWRGKAASPRKGGHPPPLTLDMYDMNWRNMAPVCYAMGPTWYLEVMWYAVKAMAMRLRYATAPSPSTTSFARHLNRWLHHLSDKIKNGLGLLIPPSMTWGGGCDYDDGSVDDIPMEFYFFDELIVRGIRGIDQKFGVDHDGYLYDAEAEGDMENDSSNTNTDSEASLEDAFESALAHA